jgi:hypothetical protein
MIKRLNIAMTANLTCDKIMRMRPVGNRNLIFITAAILLYFQELTCNTSDGKCEM